MNFLKEYTLLGELGKGGFATVYKVRHNELGYIRAVRVLNDPVVDDKCKAYRNFLRECKVLLRLGNGNHRNIVHIYQPRFLENHALVEMDFVDGTDIAHYLKKNDNFLPIDEVIRMVKEISSALAYCHEDIYKFCMDRDDDDLKDDPKDGSKVLVDEATRKRLIEKYKVIHNDIHSGNIMRREDGSFTLLDFGLAIEGDEVVKSSSRHENGAPEFMPPEKFDNELILTEQSDIYSFGVVMFEYLAGRVPFVCDGKSFSAIKNLYDVVKSHDIPAIIDLRRQNFENKFSGQKYKKDYPDWLETAILKCLEKNPAKRFKNGKELYDFVVENSNIQNSQTDNSEIMAEIKNLADNTQSIKDDFKGLAQEIHDFIKHDSDVLQRLTDLENNIKLLLSKTPEPKKHNTPVNQEAPEISEIHDNTKSHIIEPIVPRKGENESILVNGIPIEMVFVKGGTFIMGATTELTDVFEDEKPAHEVTLDDFYIGKFEVTQEVWMSIMHTNPSRFKGKHLPVEGLSWNDCQRFIQLLNKESGLVFTLPTESQWEYAARGGVLSKGYKYSGSDKIDEVAWHTGNSKNKTHNVGELKPNELGIYDMCGNIWEWCQDYYKDYLNNPEPFSVNDGFYRVLRGGCWTNYEKYCRVLCRNSQNQNYAKNIFGFRLAMNINNKTINFF